jgi:amidophosphoribosyltransferase
LHRHAADGLVANAYHEEDLEQLPGNVSIGHNRYSTSGGVGDCFNQPYVYHKQGFAFAHNGNLPDCTALEDFLGSRNVSSAELNDSGMMAAAIACYMDDGLDLSQAVIAAYPLFTGVFSSVAMNDHQLVTFRDSCGVRPLSIGQLDNGYAVASETCAFDTIGATLIRDVEPGEVVTLDAKGVHSTQVMPANQKLDIFEFVYFARPDSLLLGKRVDGVRKNFGRQMAKEYPIQADVVVPVPDSGIPAALGFSQATGIPFEMGLMKNRYIHRTFIRPTAALRERDLKMKLNPVIETIKGQSVALFDDSIVRGTTMRKVVAMMFEAGAREVHLMISCPPVRYPDFYGINTPSQSELISANMSNEELRDYVGATSLNFLSYNGMIEATGMPASSFSTSCFNGVYPVPIGKQAAGVKGAQDSRISPPKPIAKTSQTKTARTLTTPTRA